MSCSFIDSHNTCSLGSPHLPGVKDAKRKMTRALKKGEPGLKVFKKEI